MILTQEQHQELRKPLQERRDQLRRTGADAVELVHAERELSRLDMAYARGDDWSDSST